LDFDMRSVISLLLITSLFALNACDKASAPKEQVVTSEPATVNPFEPDKPKSDFSLESESGMIANLTYKFAGQPAPEFVFTGADGRDVSLSDFAGRPLLVNMWATWCAPCKAEMPALDALAELEEGKLTVIAISQDMESRALVTDFFKNKSIANLEAYTDKPNAFRAAFGGALTFPTTILFDSDGKEVWRVSGAVEWNDSEITELLNEAK
jgi:thiol-disulfide isomerase/thioredoxin